MLFAQVHDMERQLRELQKRCEEQSEQIIELEDLAQAAEDAKLRADVKLSGAQQELERALNAKDSDSEDKRRALLKQIRDLAEELDDERKSSCDSLKECQEA